MEEDFWRNIRKNYDVSGPVINLNNGGVSPQPLPVQQVHNQYMMLSNKAPSYYMWQVIDKERELIRDRLAAMAGADKEEIAIHRNTSEALNTIIFGLDLKAGDEVILTKQDYPNMINAWKQREKREGIRLVWLNLELPMEDEEAIARMFTEAFSSKTRIVHLTHMINWTGQILPAKKITDAAHQQDIEVILDAAHTFAQIPFSFHELGVDYGGTSLHKWLGAPFGTGMLYIKKEKIAGIWPLLSADNPQEDNIRKFESLGTRSFPAEMAIGAAIDFHEGIGLMRKNARLHFLKNYWAEKVLQIPGVRLNTSLKPEFSCALGHFSITGIEPEYIERQLLDKYNLHTVAIHWENIHGVRIAPNLYTTLDELDRLVEAIDEIAVSRVRVKSEKETKQ